jgi:hypothetical protein
MSIYQQEVISAVERGMQPDSGQIIPVGLERIGKHIPVRKAIYTLLGGNTGSGKTSLVDDKLVIGVYNYYMEHRDHIDMKYKCIYRSMERKRSFKLSKWTCHRLYTKYNILMDVDTMLGWQNTELTREIFNKIVECRDYFDEMMDYVDIIDGTENPTGIWKQMKSYAFANGVVIQAGDLEIRVQGQSAKGFTMEHYDITRDNEKKYYELINIPNHGEVKVYQYQKLYIPYHSNHYTQIVIDHLGKLSQERGFSSKETIDKMSEYLSDARDWFNFSPLPISQFNRAIGDVNRIKLFKGDLSPQLEDFEGSARSQHDADLVLALFNPYRYKIYDENGLYMGYQIRDRMLAPGGENRFRTLSILKNSYGKDDIQVGLKFLGECNYFETLPHPDNDVLALDRVYSDIAQGR